MKMKNRGYRGVMASKDIIVRTWCLPCWDIHYVGRKDKQCKL